MAFNIGDFSKGFLGGARPNLFYVNVTEGPISSSDASKERGLKMLAQGASLPSATIGEIIVPFMGRQLKIPGNRTYDTWDLTIINDKNFDIRDDFHSWQNNINNPETNISRLRDNDQFGQFKVVQLNTQGGSLKTYWIHNAWPSVVSDIELNWESNDALETFTVTLNYSHWTATSGGGTPGGNEGEDDGFGIDDALGLAVKAGDTAEAVRQMWDIWGR